MASNAAQNSRADSSQRITGVSRVEGVQDILEPLAIIGFALKYPQDAHSPEGFWRVMEEKRDVMTEWPENRLNLGGFVSRETTTSQRAFVPGAHFIRDDLGAFDAPFFGISATEAMAIDVQHRILLETAYHALESAGLPMEKVSGSRTGVYTGSMADDYQQIINKDADDMPKYAATGVARNMIANRLSWFYNLLGPSINMDSACSSSLMAFECACQALRSGDCDMALVAGSSLSLAPESTLSLINMSFLSPHGRCFSFDSRADGYSRGEGFTVVVVKRLVEALRDGDIVRAVVRSCGSNQDGHTPGVTQPSKDMQTAVIRETYRKAGLDLNDTRFLEAHGTGTALGDPIEAEAIGTVFRKIRSQDDPLYIGALKSNIGHLEGGSGIAGIAKAIMVLEKGVIPPNANFENINPRIDADFLNIKFPTECTPWPSSGLRRASVASFGFGGSNCHVVLDDAYNYLQTRGLNGYHRTARCPPCLDHMSSTVPDTQTLQTGIIDNEAISDGCIDDAQRIAVSQIKSLDDHEASSAGHCVDTTQILRHGIENRDTDLGVGTDAGTLLVLSTADEQGIKRLAEAYEEYFRDLKPERMDEDCLYRLAYTLATRRSSLPWKSFALIDSARALTSLKRLLSTPVPVDPNRTGGIAFIFTGQGAQYRNMGVELLAHPVFANTMKSFDGHLAKLGCTWSVADLLVRGKTFHDVHDPEYSQPMTTGLQLALFELLKSLAVHPTVVIGHSSGEIAAAYAAGALNMASACRASYYRGKHASDLKKSATAPGAMLSVDLAEAQMQHFLAAHPQRQGNLYIACVNSPCNVTISGDEAAIDSLEVELESQNIRMRRLQTNVAYHSPHMNHVAVQYAKSIAHLEPSPTETGGSMKRPKMISSVTGNYVSDLNDVCCPEYWTTNLISPVKFLQAMSAITLTSDKPKTKKLGEDRVGAIHDFVEVGPHSALRRPVLEWLDHRKVAQAKERYHTVLIRQSSATRSVLRLAGELHVRGHPVNIDKANQVNLSFQSKHEPMVDLPSYPFNHSKAYWYESPISRHSRLRKASRLELLGVPVPDWNPLEPRWRLFFDSSEMPWIGHHKVNGRIIYPATGMCVMAVEGATQIADSHRGISGYHIRDAVFAAPISIGIGDRCEVQLHMRSNHAQADKDSTSFEFRVYSKGQGEWVENCHGFIQVLYERYYHGLDGTARQRESEFYHQKFRDATQRCNLSISTERMYDLFKHNGLDYGPSFQALSKLRWDGNTIAIGHIKCFRWTSDESSNLIQEHVAHPTTLDAVGQLGWVSLTKGAKEVLADGFAVTRIRNAWLASSGLSYPETDHLQAYCSANIKGPRVTHSSMFALDPHGKLVMSISYLEMTSLDQGGTILEQPIPRSICYRMSYKPDLALLDRQQLLAALNTDTKRAVDPVAFCKDLELVLFYFALKAVERKETGASLYPDSKPHMTKYLSWIKHQLDKHEIGKLGHSQSDWVVRAQDTEAMEQLVGTVEHANSQGSLFVQIGRRLQSIIQGHTDPLEVMFESGLVERHYQELCDQMICCKQMVNYFRLFSHKHPHLKVLEVGAGTGSMTRQVLQGLQPGFIQYDYTDISEAFFERARDKFRTTGHNINYRRLDIEQDPVDQGYDVGSYDVVIAGWVLHATRDLTAAVRNVRRLLKPNGKIVLLENTKPEILRSGFAFGTLPGWWLSNDGREWSPCITEGQWTGLLEKTGFRGVDVILPDYESEICHENSIIIATAADSTDPGDLQIANDELSISLIVRGEDALQNQVAEKLRCQLNEQRIFDSQIILLGDQNLSELCRGTILVFLAELERPYLSTLDKTSFESLQDVLVLAQKVLWVSSSSRNLEQSAELQMIRGMSRVLCTEKASMVFATLNFEDSQLHVDSLVEDICKIVLETVTNSSSECEPEYIKRDGTFMINRVVEAEQLNEEVHSKTHTVLLHQEIGQGEPVCLAVPRSGLLDSIEWKQDLTGSENLGPEQIEIQVQALGVNFRDLLILLGKYSANAVGTDCAGVVTRVGTKCTTLQKGDRVCALTLDCFRTYTRCHHLLAVKIPDCLSTAEAASLPTTGVTAYYALNLLGNLQKKESILIHSASGGTGQMALQIAQIIGADVFVTVGSDDKRQLLHNTYGVPYTHIFSSRDTSFCQEILRATHGKGVDVVLNSLSGKALLASWECIAPFGRFIELGKKDIAGDSNLPMSQFAKEVTFRAVAVDFVSIERPIIVQRALQAIVDSVVRGQIKVASPLDVYTVSKIDTAFRVMQSGNNMGKAVLTLTSSDLVPKWIRPRFSCSLDPEATYLIAGGLGGLGRSAARWMVQQGARHLILLSRSGPKSLAAQALMKDLYEKGATIRAPKCDVSCYESLTTALGLCSDLPPIRGCLQATMVLQDSLFERMTWDQWSASVRSKVASTQNLHRLLPRGLSFFVMLSSAAGVAGAIGQSNYAAGNTYQDGLASHRISVGEKAISIDLGLMGDVGIVAENIDIAKGNEVAAELAPILEVEFLALLDRYCDPKLGLLVAEEAQPILGLITPAQFRSKNIEPPQWLLDRPIFRGLLQEDRGSGYNPDVDASAKDCERDWAAEFVKAPSDIDATSIVTEALIQRLAKAISMLPSEIDPAHPLHTYGVDSLLAVEVRNWFGKVFKADVAIFDITGQGSIGSLAESATGQSSLRKLKGSKVDA